MPDPTLIDEVRTFARTHRSEQRQRQLAVAQENRTKKRAADEEAAERLKEGIPIQFKEAIQRGYDYIRLPIAFGECEVWSCCEYFHVLSGATKIVRDWAVAQGCWTTIIPDKEKTGTGSTQYFILVLAVPPEEKTEE